MIRSDPLDQARFRQNRMANNNEKSNNTDKRGFASMDAGKQREIASEGGKAAHESGNAHEWTSDEAREAGRKGGKASHSSTSSETAAEEESMTDE
jgi:general stress protein YciG